jgi:HK97 family phage major capsid protein
MSMIRSISLRLDQGLFQGSGASPEIRGLANTAGIQTVSSGANGSIPGNLDAFADAIGLASASNAEATAIFMHPRTWRTLMKVKETSTANKALLQAETGGAPSAPRFSLYGLPVHLSSQLSTSEVQGTSGAVSTSAYVVDVSQCVVVMRQDVRVERDSSRLFNSDVSEIRAIMRADFVVPNPAAVVRVTGILA